MIWKNFVTLSAIMPRRRVAAAIVYGLSLAVRFTSATGEQVEIAPLPMQRTNPATSIMARNDAQIPYGVWSPDAAQPIFFRYRRTASPTPGCSAP
jgi:hypothetical protein